MIAEIKRIVYNFQKKIGDKQQQAVLSIGGHSLFLIPLRGYSVSYSIDFLAKYTDTSDHLIINSNRKGKSIIFISREHSIDIIYTIPFGIWIRQTVSQFILHFFIG